MKRVRLFEIFGLVALLALTGIACVSNAANANGDKLEGVTWVLKYYGDPDNLTSPSVDRPGFGSAVTLTFDKEEGTASGSGGVNSYGGNYQADGNKLTISNVVRTLIASTNEALNKQENEFFKILDSAQSYDIDDGELTITGGEGVLVFEEK
jgi:heat shock protein HslJ